MNFVTFLVDFLSKRKRTKNNQTKKYQIKIFKYEKIIIDNIRKTLKTPPQTDKSTFYAVKIIYCAIENPFL
ncbi:hypothetical protein [Motilimonas sp. KMU-193]|uniref:hypothetical protein n=1 Tax=Motilimonas sp. KMU-193 TaxID=3388668 RepID=UPI00396AF0AD